MSKRIYSEEEIKLLSANPNIIRCSNKSVTYRKEFKIKAVLDYYQQGLSPKTIFKKAGFDLNILGADKPKACLKLWKKIYKSRGQSGLLNDERGKYGGRKPKPQVIEDMDYLKTKIAYLEAENDFLKKLKTKTKS